MSSKICSVCNLELPFSKFTPSKAGKHGLHSQCKLCRNVYAKNQRKTDNSKQWEATIKHRYGASQDWYNEQLKIQEYKCAICHSDTPGGGRTRWAIDHDHNTGQVRALLCLLCNTGLGKFKDNADLLEKAAKYLRYHS